MAEVGQLCMHTKGKDQLEYCEECLDTWGDHAVICKCGAHLFVRHSALNHVLAEAGRAAGYTAFLEQVVLELCQTKEDTEGNVKMMETRIDVELFGHPYAPSHLLDGTIRHPGAASHLENAAHVVGFAAEEGVKAKLKRYPAKNGKLVLGCSLETWGRSSATLDTVLRDLAVLASQRQRDRGIYLTKWLLKWLKLSQAVCLKLSVC